MFETNMFVFLALAVALAVLALVMVFLAAQHDKAVALAGPLEEERAVAARIEEKRRTIADLEDDLEKRRQALAHVAEIGAEVDALERKRDDLLAEWNQSEARRSEVEAIRHETEAARTEKLEAEATLAEARANLEEVKDRLSKAEGIDHRIETLSQERERLESEVQSLRENLDALQAAEARINALENEAKRLEADAAVLTGKIAAKTSELNELEDRLASARMNHSAQKDESERLAAEVAAARQRSNDLVHEQSVALDRIGELEARKASIEREIEKARGQATGQAGAPEEDPLRELKQPPQVLNGLVSWPLAPAMNEADALKSVKDRFKAYGLTYPDRTLHAFHTAMKVNDTTQMAVLAGISGTGKSQLPRQYAAGMGIGFLQIPVQPRWDSPQDLMGFYNYIEGRFRPTDMARALFALDEQNNEDAVNDRMLMILLDEMNLARVEYYFSDFLSRLESRPAKGRESDRNLRKDAEIELEIPKAQQRIFPGYNLLFAGTMNEDESTQSLSDKVVDRANVMRFGAPRTLVQANVTNQPPQERALSRRQWDRWCARSLPGAEQLRARGRIDEMLELMQNFGKPFGHRLGRAILAFTSAYPEVESISDRVSTALADQIEMRLLPKLRGVDVEEMGQHFDRLRKLSEDLGDEALADAIRQSVDAAEGTGQFVWKGVIR
ncbi:McrB family protein [Pseudotabrizicola formosa]|uniref:McrB family protein n=1 Tax=Pseudotabrizicola formosa TaxID=2030009 RepID=UPI000CCFF86D|nr:chromosome segregation ATPase-like protein [Pseudotabrizicola formosa]